MKKILFLCFVLSPSLLVAQHSIGIGVHSYPEGIIPTLRFDYELQNNSYLNIRAGYNFTDREDWGKHDSEKGGGFGFGLGYEYQSFFIENLSLMLGTDLYFMEIDWEDTRRQCGVVPPCTDIQTKNSTNITMLQPAIGLAYQLNLNKHVSLKPNFSFGYEFNLITKGEPVGEGSIILVGLNLSYYFKH